MGVEMEDQKEKTRCPSCGNVGRVSGDDPSEICEKCKAREAAAGYALASEPEEESGELADLDVAALRLIARDRGINLRGVTRDERSLRAAILRGPAAQPAAPPAAEPPPAGPDESIDDLAELMVSELRELAEERDIGLTGLRTKADIIAALETGADA
jgi:hypothetical protein